MSPSKRRRLARERAQRSELSHADHRFISQLTEKGGNVLSKHKAKGGKKFVRHCHETDRFTSGFKGDVPSVGKEMGADFIGRFRVKDGTRSMRAKCWMRKSA